MIGASPAPAAQTDAAPAPRSLLSEEAGASLAAKLDTLARRAEKKKPPREKTVTVTEAELNSYLNITLASRLPKGVSDLEVTMERDALSARALVDLAEVQLRAGRESEALMLIREALELLDNKGAVLPAEHARARFAELLTTHTAGGAVTAAPPESG